MAVFTRKEFLEALYNDYFSKRDGFIMVKTARHLDRRISTRFFPNVEILSKEQYQADQNVFLGICPRETMKPEQRNIHYVTALWAGLDLTPDGYSGKDVYFFSKLLVAKAVRSFPLPPSIVVESGNGMHLYWILKEVTELHDISWVETQLGTINGYFRCRNPVKIDTFLRLPETTNCKNPGQALECRVKFVNSEFRYDLTDFAKLNLVTRQLRTRKQPIEVQESAAQSDSQPDEARSEELEVDDGEDLLEFLTPEAMSAQQASTPAPIVPPLAANASSQEQRVVPKLIVDFEPLPYEGTYEPVVPSTATLDPQSPREPVREQIEKQPSQIAQPSTVIEAVPGPEHEVEILEDGSVELIADRIVEKVVDRLSNQLLDTLADRIVEKLALRLAGVSSPRR